MATEFTLEQSIQTVLGLPELNRTETRRNLGMVFAAYRRCKLILKMGIERSQPRTPAVPEYENAMEPDLISAPYRVSGSMPHGFGGQSREYSFTLEDFVYRVERKIHMLPDVKREIIKRRYLVLGDRLPSDSEVMYQLERINLAVSERKYYRKKQEALMVLAYAFGVEVDETP